MNIYEIQQRILEFAPDAPDEWDWMDAEDEEPEYEVRMYFFGSLGSAFFLSISWVLEHIQRNY